MLKLSVAVGGRRLIVGIALIVCAACQRNSAPPPPAPIEVAVTKVAVRDEAVSSEWIGTVVGFVNADIRAQVSGYLLRQAYGEGSRVKKGDLLFEIDPRPLQAAYAMVKANYDKANLDLSREKTLVEKDAVARREYENAVAALASAEAALQQARLNVEFTRLVSPLDGIAGIATAQIGDLVGPGTGALTTVSQLEPVKVQFSITEQSYLEFRRSGPGQPRFPEELTLQLILADDTVYSHSGKFFAADRQIDQSTGTLLIIGVFPNPDYLLRPGQYCRIRAVVKTLPGALEVPQRAVAELQGGFQVATVDAAGKAHIVAVKVGDRVGDRWVITAGLKPDDVVVVDGFPKLHEGSSVVTHPLR